MGSTFLDYQGNSDRFHDGLLMIVLMRVLNKMKSRQDNAEMGLQKWIANMENSLRFSIPGALAVDFDADLADPQFIKAFTGELEHFIDEVGDLEVLFSNDLQALMPDFGFTFSEVNAKLVQQQAIKLWGLLHPK